MKNREAVSEVINDLRALNITQRISERYVLGKLKHFNALFLKRENDKLRLSYYDNIWHTIECIKMIPADVSECTNTRLPKIFSYIKSEKPLPEVYSYSNGPLIKDLMTLDEGHTFLHTTLEDFKNISKREFKGKERYFWIRNNHIIIPNGTAEMINITACFKNIDEAKKINECSDNCVFPLDEEFPCPLHLFQVVRQETTKDLFSFYKRIETQ